jgi:transposase
MDFHLNSLLNLANATVFTCYKETDFIGIHLQLNNEGINCPNCQEYTDCLHNTSYRLVRDLSICGNQIYLKVPRRKFYCKSCGRYPTEILSWIEKGRAFTCRYEDYIYAQVKTLTVEQVSKQENLGRDQVQRIFSRITARELAKKTGKMYEESA